MRSSSRNQRTLSSVKKSASKSPSRCREETKQQRNDQIHKTTEDLQNRELEVLQRAKALEIEMEAIKQAKLDQVMAQFELQIRKDAESEEQRLRDALEETFEKDVNRLDAERVAHTQEID